VHSPAPRLLISSRVDVAIATGADGVHLTSSPDALTPVQVRSLYAAAGLPEPLVSISCHTLDDVARAAAATHILFGPVFEKVVADKLVTAGTGLDLLRSASAAAAPIPVLALGGITPANAQDCLADGAAGIAAIRLFSSDSAAILPNSAIDLDRATPYA
jgi:thiamine-phosphate pyrophosphorylase